MSDQGLTYEEWTERLGSFFFDSAHEGHEVLFAVDDITLAEITGLPGEDGATSLGVAVRGLITRNWDVRQISYSTRRWRTGGMVGDHPALPFLALTVLAASRMQADEHAAASNFYVRLRTALNARDEGRGTPGTYLEYVRALWADLAKWANDDLGGRRGRLVVRPPGPQFGRGAAVQHALVRSSDLGQLDSFFRRIGLQPGEDVLGVELLRSLRVWTETRPEQWAKRLHRLASDSDLAEFASGLLEREASRWDGRPRDRRTGRAIGQIRLGISQLRNPKLGLFLRADGRLPMELQITLPGSEAVAVVQAGDWFEPHPLDHPDISGALANGLRVQAGQWRFEFRAEDAYPLAYDDELGLWVTVDSISFGDRYHVLVRTHLADEVQRWATRVSATEPKIDAASNRQLPVGWALVQNIQLERRPTGNSPACLAGALPTGSGPRLRLVGGLPLTAGHAVYLRGGEPGLALSTLVSDAMIAITEEATGKTEKLTAGENREEEVPLWKLQLVPGGYRVQHGETSVGFRIVDGIAEVAGPGAGTVRLTSGAREDVVGTAPLAAVTVPSPPTVRAPHAGLAVFILGPGVDDVRKVEVPKWVTSFAGQLSWNYVDFWSEFVPVWQITKRHDGRLTATPINPIDPLPCADATSSWARIVKLAVLEEGVGEPSRQLWASYQAVAGGGS